MWEQENLDDDAEEEWDGDGNEDDDDDDDEFWDEEMDEGEEGDTLNWILPSVGHLSSSQRDLLMHLITTQHIDTFMKLLDSIISENPLFDIDQEILCIDYWKYAPCTLLTFAIRQRSRAIVRLLIGEYGASPYQITLSQEFLQVHEKVSYLTDSPLTTAIYCKDIEMVKYFVEVIEVNVNNTKCDHYNYIFHTFIVMNIDVGSVGEMLHLDQHREDPIISIEDHRTIDLLEYLLNEIGASTNQMARCFGGCKSNLPLARCMAESSVIFSTEEKLCLLLLCYRFSDPYSQHACDSFFRTIKLPLSHYRYVFETLDIKDEMTSLPTSLLVPHNPKAIGITAKLFLQANAINFDIVKYLVETVGLDPNIGWFSESPSSSLLYNLKHACDMEYLIEKCGSRVTKELMMHYIRTKERIPMDCISNKELMEFMTVFAKQPGMDLKVIRFGENEDSLLHICCQQRPDVSLIRGLIEKCGLNATVLNRMGQTILMRIDISSIALTAALNLLDYLVLEVGLDINARDNTGKTAAMIFDFTRLIHARDVSEVKAHLRSLNAIFNN